MKRIAVLILTMMLAGCGTPDYESLFFQHVRCCPKCRTAWPTEDEPICPMGEWLLEAALPVPVPVPEVSNP